MSNNTEKRQQLIIKINAEIEKSGSMHRQLREMKKAYKELDDKVIDVDANLGKLKEELFELIDNPGNALA